MRKTTISICCDHCPAEVVLEKNDDEIIAKGWSIYYEKGTHYCPNCKRSDFAIRGMTNRQPLAATPEQLITEFVAIDEQLIIDYCKAAGIGYYILAGAEIIDFGVLGKSVYFTESKFNVDAEHKIPLADIQRWVYSR